MLLQGNLFLLPLIHEFFAVDCTCSMLFLSVLLCVSLSILPKALEWHSCRSLTVFCAALWRKERINEFTVTFHYSNTESWASRRTVLFVWHYTAVIVTTFCFIYFFFENFMYECYLKQLYSVVWVFSFSFGRNKNSIDPWTTRANAGRVALWKPTVGPHCWGQYSHSSLNVVRLN